MTESAYQHLLKGWNPKAAPTAAVHRRIDDEAMRSVSAYTGLGHKYINPVLRGQKAPPPYEGLPVGHLVRGIDRAVDSSTVNRRGKVYRGLNMDEAQFQQMLQRGRWGDAGYMSTSTNPQTALSFIPVTGNGRKVVFAIDVKPGQRALSLDNEAEILIARGSEIRDLVVRIDPDGTAVVYGRLYQGAR